MKKLNKLQINSERLMKKEDLLKLKGGKYPKIEACEDKAASNTCTWVDAAGNTNTGRCLAFAPTYTLHCSDLL